MHQHPRPSARVTSPATLPQTNPTRTNNQRDTTQERARNSMDSPYSDRGPGYGYPDEPTQVDDRQAGQARDLAKLNQVIQQFYAKAALMIVSSRVTLRPSFRGNGNEIRQNKWFNVILDDSDELLEQITDWKTAVATEERPPPLVIEIYLDTSDLPENQTLSIRDDNGKSWDVVEGLDMQAAGSSLGTRDSARGGRSTHIVLERWTIELGDQAEVPASELNDTLPNVYKKAVVLFRGLYSYSKFLPVWKLNKRMAKDPAGHSSVKLNYRVVNGDFRVPRPDTLELPLYPHSSAQPVTEEFRFQPTNCPLGPLMVRVAYRLNCEFRVQNSEELLSSRMMAMDLDDEPYAMPATSQGGPVRPGTGRIGSLPVDQRFVHPGPDHTQAYGSMSTFHQVGPPTGTSPISALRAAAQDVTVPSPPTSSPQKLPPSNRLAQASRSSLRSNESAPTTQRRTSVSFQPFKAGSLSSSPATGVNVPPSPGTSLGRNTALSALHQARNRNSLTTIPQTALRAPSLPNETAIASSGSSSPKPAPISRYSSSFGHRRSRFSSGGSNLQEDNVSSGRGSVASSAQPGSDVLGGGDASSGSLRSDEDNISDFLKLLEQKKDLKSFNRTDPASRDASTRRTAAQLSKYQRMRDTTAALSDSISSSQQLLHRSSTSSSRALSSVPPMIHGTSLSSAGKSISPRTPHTPAIPSGLSNNSIVDYSEEAMIRRSRDRSRARFDREATITEANTIQTTPRESGSNAIDIPQSPRPYLHGRRSSSVSQQRNIDDDVLAFGHRSASQPQLSLSDLLRIQEPISPNALLPPPADEPVDERILETEDDSLSRQLSSSIEANRIGAAGTIPFLTRNTGRGRGAVSAHSSSSNLAAAGTGSGSGSGGSERGGRFVFRSGAQDDDDEQLLFDMSEINTQYRKSLEDGRGGSATGAAYGSDRGGSDSRGASRRGGSRRGSAGWRQ